MTELLVTPKSLSYMETLIDLGADAFVIGEQKFGLRLPGEFNRQQMTEAVALAHKNDKKIILIFYMKYELTELFSGIQQ